MSLNQHDMKKYYFIGIFLLVSQIFFSQTRRFVYEYRFAVDSTQVDSLKTEMMFLDIDKDKSTYFSETKFREDSININSLIQQQKLNTGSTSISSHSKPWNVMYTVTKHYPSHDVFLQTWVESTQFLVKSQSKMNWKIQSDTQTIADYPCQKATLDFGGRHWTAWFTTEIPIPEGPYKFHGLPGLIVKMEDATKTHFFLLKGNKKLRDKNGLDYIQNLGSEAYGGFFKPVKVSHQQYKKLLKQYRNDPVKDLRQRLSQGNYKVVIETDDGREISDNTEVIRAQEKRMKEYFKKYNNSIELDVYR